jgi:HEPN domain-containing protein
MSANNEVSEWIRLAEMDIATAHHMFNTFHPKPLEIVCFHSQQAVEKIIKCYLVSQGHEPLKTHDLQVLMEMCIDINALFDDVYEEAITLTSYAVRVRYPTELDITEQDAATALENADKVIRLAKTQL